jgi:hypothetical protein
MKETQGIIERVIRVNNGYQHLEVAVDPSLVKIKPGQSLLARRTDDWDPYLREHWWPVGIGDNRLIIERPTGTRYEPNQVVSLLGLVGQPYRFRRTLRNVLLLTYDTPPTPLLMTIPWLLGNKVSVTMVLLGTAVEYQTEHLPPEVEVIHGEDDLRWAEQVMTVGWADQVFVTVDRGDELQGFGRIVDLFRELRADVPQNYLFGVFRPILTCGAGACSSCMVQMTGRETRLICTEGPCFDLTGVQLP